MGSRSVNVGATAERVSEAHARVALPARTRAEVPSSSCSSNGSGERAVRAGSDSGDRVAHVQAAAMKKPRAQAAKMAM